MLPIPTALKVSWFPTNWIVTGVVFAIPTKPPIEVTIPDAFILVATNEVTVETPEEFILPTNPPVAVIIPTTTFEEDVNGSCAFTNIVEPAPTDTAVTAAPTKLIALIPVPTTEPSSWRVIPENVRGYSTSYEIISTASSPKQASFRTILVPFVATNSVFVNFTPLI